MTRRYQFVNYAKHSSMGAYSAKAEKSKTNHLIVFEGRNKKKTKSIIKKLKDVKDVNYYKNHYFVTFHSVDASQEAYHKLEHEDQLEVYQDSIVKAQG